MIESILVATDGSECAAAAEKCAISLASRLGASLSGITVVEDCINAFAEIGPDVALGSQK